MVWGKIIYGSWKNGSDIYKDRKGYFIVQWNVKTEKESKKYLASWKPSPSNKKLYFNEKTNKWQSTKPINS